MATTTTTGTGMNQGTAARTFNRNVVWIILAAVIVVLAIAAAVNSRRTTTDTINSTTTAPAASVPGATPGTTDMTAPGVDTTAPQNTAPATSETPTSP